MNSTYQKLENASNREVRELHGQLFRKIKQLQRDRNLVLEELDARHAADGTDDETEAELDVLQ